MTASARFEYFDHDADVGIRARGPTVESLFATTARALFCVEADLARVHPQSRIAFDFEESDVELALVEWLNGLVARAHTERLVPAFFRVERAGSHWQCEAAGEHWRRGIARGVEVKGATLTSLAVRPVNDSWEAQLIVDV